MGSLCPEVGKIYPCIYIGAVNWLESVGYKAVLACDQRDELDVEKGSSLLVVTRDSGTGKLELMLHARARERS